jgi:pilus assembly protein Flp/PilA
MRSRLKCAAERLITDEEGATMVEYGLMLFLIAALCVSIVSVIGDKSERMYNSVQPSFDKK